MTVHEKQKITREDYEMHECRTSREDGCAACIAWQEQEDEAENETCSFGICDGSGVVVEGEHDDLWEKKCLCALDVDSYNPDHD